MIKAKIAASSSIAPATGHWFRLYQIAAGAAVFIIGAMLWVGFQLHLYWLEYATLPAVGLVFLTLGWITHSFRKLIAGSLLFGTGLGFAAVLANVSQTNAEKVGLFGGLFGLGWFMVVFFSKMTSGKTAWWALILASLSVGVGVIFSDAPIGISAGLGVELILLALVFFAWGLVENKNGMVIAGGNLVGLGLGCIISWSDLFAVSILSKIGIFLIGFALGWVLILLFSNFSGEVTLWWALIPAGVMGIVGWGLYIGGRTFVFAEVIGNIGSIALIAIGLYLLLLRSGMRK